MSNVWDWNREYVRRVTRSLPHFSVSTLQSTPGQTAWGGDIKRRGRGSGLGGPDGLTVLTGSRLRYSKLPAAVLWFSIHVRSSSDENKRIAFHKLIHFVSKCFLVFVCVFGSPRQEEGAREAISGPPSPEHSNEETNDRNLKFESKKTFRSEIRIIHYSPESSSGDRAGHDSAELIIESWHIQCKTFVILFQPGEASASLSGGLSHTEPGWETPGTGGRKILFLVLTWKMMFIDLTLHYWQDWQKMLN